MAPFPTRKEELLRIRANKKAKLKNIFKNLDYSEEEPIVLTAGQFMAIAFLCHLNPANIFQFLNLVLLHDPISTCIIYVLLVSVLGVPISMLVNFMSSYSGRSYLKFWDCVPVFQGLGYTLGILRMSTEIMNVVHAAIALIYLLKVQTPNYKDDVTSCAVEGVEEFYDTVNQESYNVSMCNVRQYDYRPDCATYGLNTAMQFYHTNQIVRYKIVDDSFSFIVNTDLLCATLFTWTLIFVVSIMGLQRIKRLAFNVQITFTLSIVVLSVVTLLTVEAGPIDDTRQVDKSFKNSSRFLVGLIFHAAEINILCNMIWLGTMKPDAVHPKFASMIVPPIKMVVLIFLFCTMSLLHRDNALYYNFSDVECLKLSDSSHVLFVLVPDVLLRHDTWRVTLSLWYFSLYAFMVLPTIYSTIALLASLEEKFHKLKKNRIPTSLVICAIGFALTVPIVTESGESILVVWKFVGYNIALSAIMLFVNLAVFLVYTTDQIINDYTFAFGKPPEKYWTTLWRCCPMFAIFGFLFTIRAQIPAPAIEGRELEMMRATYIYSGVVLCPIIIIAIVQFCKNVKTRSLQKLIESTEDWGPKDEKKREARRNFYPQRNVRFRVDRLVCKHNCSIANGDKYRDEILLQRRKLAIFEKKYGNVIT